MSLATKADQRYSYEDYKNWGDETRWEIIDGRAYAMVPAPSTRHQDVCGNIFAILRSQLADKKCKAYIAPTDVVLDQHNIVQPDVIVVCDKNQITRENIQGPPAIIFEVISPTSTKVDRLTKRGLYQKFGVKEYLIVYPELGMVERFTLEKHAYAPTEYILDSHDEEYNKELRIELCFEDAGIYLKLLDIFEQ